MIEFKQLEMQDFGPYRGIQSLKFERSKGVWIVYGDNGRGKTSLLNAFGYALYGNLRGRISSIEPARMVNSITRIENDGVGQMRVTLEMVVNERENWEVTRQYDESRPDPEQLIVSIDNDVKTAEQGKRRLRALLPEELSDFFLFNGEDLRKYEHLLEQDSEEAGKLRSAIGRVLGIPTLRQAAAALDGVHGDATKLIAEHMKRSDKTRAAGEALAEAQDLLDQYAEQAREEKKELAKEQQRKDEIEEQLRQHRRAESIMESLDVLREEKDKREDEFDEATSDFKKVTPQLWRLVVADKCKTEIERLKRREEHLRQGHQKQAFESQIRKDVKDNQQECPVCSKPLSKGEASQIIEDLSDANGDNGYLAEVNDVVSKRRLLQRIVSSVERQTVLDREKHLDSARLRLRQTISQIEEKEELLKELGQDEAEIRSLREARANCEIRISNIKDRLKGLEQNIEQQQNRIPGLREKANRGSGSLDPAIDALEAISESMRDLFSTTADAYRERVREDVERRASEIFLRIAAEPDYKALEINDSYGLAILDADGRQIPNRSAGYEHLVALSLIAALQSFSPNRGPVVVDSPFQRLDEKNTSLVMGALPDIASQTLLLVFEKQFDRQAAIRALEGKLVDEYELERVSSRETTLVTRTEKS